MTEFGQKVRRNDEVEVTKESRKKNKLKEEFMTPPTLDMVSQ
jgi:hypothetical protein